MVSVILGHDPYIEWDKNGNIVVQDPQNGRHKFLTPALKDRDVKYASIGDFADALYDRYEFTPWIYNEGLTIKPD